MITIATLMVAFFLWQYIVWRVIYIANASVEQAVLATRQALDMDRAERPASQQSPFAGILGADVKLSSPPDRRLSPEKRQEARAHAARLAIALIGRWHITVLRLALGLSAPLLIAAPEA